MKRQLTLLAAILALTLQAASANETRGSVITVEGTGIISKAPDMATVSAGVQSNAKSAQEALADNNTKMSALLETLQKAGIDKKDIQTSNFNIYPQIVYPKRNSDSEPQAPEIVGYSVNNQVSVTIRKLDTVGGVLTALINSGANNLSGLQFGITDKQDLLDEARKAALADARHKAELYATALGKKVERLSKLSEQSGSNYPAPVMMRAAKMEMVASDVPVSQGELEISVTVNTDWQIGN